MSNFQEGLYWIRNRNTGTVLDITSFDSGAQVKGAAQQPTPLFDVNLNLAQLWLVEALRDLQIYHIRNLATGLVLDVKGGSSEETTPIIVYVDSKQQDNQHWKIEWIKDEVDNDRPVTYYKVTCVQTNTVMDQTGNEGAPVQAWKYHGGGSQLWAFESATFPPMYWIRHIPTNLVIQSGNSSQCIGATRTDDADQLLSQLWLFQGRENDTNVTIRNANGTNGLVLDIDGSNFQDGTAILAWSYHGGQNQQWAVTKASTNNDNIWNIKNPFGSVSVQLTSSNPQIAAYASSSSSLQTWAFDPYPLPSFFWVTIQNIKTGYLLSQNENGEIVPSVGASNMLDYSVQWLVVPYKNTPRYSIINRASRKVLDHYDGATSGTSIKAENDNREDPHHQWLLQPVGNAVGIVNVKTNCALDHYNGDSIQAYQPGIDDPHRQWSIVDTIDRIPSFAIISGSTGRSLMYQNADPTVITDASGSLRSLEHQWLFRRLTDSEDSEYTIINRLSGNVLDHYGGTRIEAKNNDESDPHHRWRIVPCHDRYFGLLNVATGKFLDEKTPGTPNATSSVMDHDTDNTQCWQLVSSRYGEFDFVEQDDDVLMRLVPYVRANDGTTGDNLAHHIVKRAPKKPQKGKDKTAQTAGATRPGRITVVENQVMQEILGLLIGDWIDNQIGRTQPPRTLVSLTRREIQQRWPRINIPPSLREGSDVDGWVRIDLQGTYDAPEGRVANIQGQWGTNTVFHVIIPAGVNVGAERIRQAMRDSLRTSQTVSLVETNAKPPGGGPKPKPGPRPPPPAPGMGGIAFMTTLETAAIGFLILLASL